MWKKTVEIRDPKHVLRKLSSSARVYKIIAVLNKAEVNVEKRLLRLCPVRSRFGEP